MILTCPMSPQPHATSSKLCILCTMRPDMREITSPFALRCRARPFARRGSSRPPRPVSRVALNESDGHTHTRTHTHTQDRRCRMHRPLSVSLALHGAAVSTTCVVPHRNPATPTGPQDRRPLFPCRTSARGRDAPFIGATETHLHRSHGRQWRCLPPRQIARAPPLPGVPHASALRREREGLQDQAFEAEVDDLLLLHPGRVEAALHARHRAEVEPLQRRVEGGRRAQERAAD